MHYYLGLSLQTWILIGIAAYSLTILLGVVLIRTCIFRKKHCPGHNMYCISLYRCSLPTCCAKRSGDEKPWCYRCLANFKCKVTPINCSQCSFLCCECTWYNKVTAFEDIV